MKKKIALMATSLVLVVAMAVGGTLAYLQATTKAVTNTFTFGAVDLTLDEIVVNEYGVATSTERTEGEATQTYKLIPDHEYTKDPTLHVTANEDSYLFVKVVNPIAGIEEDGDYKTIAEQMKDNGWEPLEGVTDVYWQSWEAGSAADVAVFAKFKLKANAEVAQFNGQGIVITGYAVQADGMTNEKDAWTKANFS